MKVSRDSVRVCGDPSGTRLAVHLLRLAGHPKEVSLQLGYSYGGCHTDRSMYIFGLHYCFLFAPHLIRVRTIFTILPKLFGPTCCSDTKWANIGISGRFCQSQNLIKGQTVSKEPELVGRSFLMICPSYSFQKFDTFLDAVME